MPQDPNRRDFIRTAGLLGAGSLAAVTASADESTPTAGKPGSIAGAGAAPSSALADPKVPLAPPDRQPPKLKVPEPPKRKVGWAVVGLGQLSLEEIMPAFGACELSEPVALVSGHPDKARKVAEAYGVDPGAIYGYEDYDRIAENDRIEVVYVVLPNSMHAEYTIRALKAGKHVLCEKPMAVTVEECEAIIAASREARRKLMIAYRLHYEPYNLTAMDLLAKKEFGPIRTFSSSNVQDVKAPNIRLSRGLGGGPVGDIGIYSINAARYCTGEEPVEVTAVAHRPDDDLRFREVPARVAFTLKFPSGVLAHCDCAFDGATSRRYRVHCEKGFVDLDPAFAYRGLRLRTTSGGGEHERATEHRLLEPNQFASEMDHFSDCVIAGKDPRTPGEEGLADMRVMVAIDEAARSGRPVRVAT